MFELQITGDVMNFVVHVRGLVTNNEDTSTGTSYARNDITTLIWNKRRP